MRLIVKWLEWLSYALLLRCHGEEANAISELDGRRTARSVEILNFLKGNENTFPANPLARRTEKEASIPKHSSQCRPMAQSKVDVA
eukprot:scaffold12152_cov52-Cyclotella_meneghiniana.AAC.3